MKNKKTILLVDDELPLLRILEEKLRREGFNVFIAEEGKRGLEIALNKRPDLILLDLIMPIMDGFTFLKKIEKDSWGRTAKIILMTNLDALEKKLEESNYEVLIKSDWKIADIIEKIKKETS